MQKLLFVMNPVAGQRKANRFLPEIITLFNNAGYEVTTFMTSGPGNGTEIVEARAKDFDLVVCAGGDGTLNETVTGVLRAGAACPIGYIPCGSTNDFASSLKLSANPLQAAQDIIDGVPTEYDVGKFGDDRYFVYVASFGAFTRVSYTTPQSVKNALGHLAYVLEGIQELAQIRATHARFVLDGETIEDEFIFGAITNTTSVGGVLTLDPKQVDMRDGKFELLLVRLPRDLTELHECANALRTQQYDCNVITFRSVSELTVCPDPEMPWTLDGEREDGHEVIKVQNLHHAVKLMLRQEEIQ